LHWISRALAFFSEAFLTAFSCNAKCYGKNEFDDGEAENWMS
jgi:hypothetical protein